MEMVLAILIIVPTAVALLAVMIYLAGAILSLFGAGLDGLAVGIGHRIHPVPHH